MSGTEIVELSQEEMDAVIYDAREGDLDTLKEIFDEISPSLLLKIKDDITLSTPIHMAAANGHLEVLDYLLSIVSKEDAQILVNAPNESGNTSLHWAAFNGHLEVLKLLTDKYEGDVFAKNSAGRDVMFEAENNDQEEIEQWFLKKYSVESDFKVEEGEEESKITYAPGSESKEAEERAKEAEERAKEAEQEDSKGLATKIKNLSVS
ncbi:ankyrin repeat-containing protein [Yamadazyma tenuis]|uniref:Ankyrin repeat-containing protein n=1 Tax=Candida tenuis (strain ATCC 10573 / BCRC 21748 / CBS 615 / JCM 9827 / NBRC 10315 / NRRL Y-1498 / VKM Y-70) TaxID=590646 RepID=G3AY08_CANTC|nr:ankyrin repeat-containing protein [Yamadazyma tenuis ATCC 10573]EGV65742.1 ankyrin repeat-containing protein [Yamadazyma tenuis ATCC 10573]WEJ95940.1 ankyrin repeat-containing protein [Yamadazyma tenuis]